MEDYDSIPEHRFYIFLKEIPEASLHEYGATREEALKNLEEQFYFLQEELAKRQRELPKPSINKCKDYSGKLLLRMPWWLHKKLTVLADEEESSLNSYIVNLLSTYSIIEETRNVTESIMKNLLSRFYWTTQESAYTVTAQQTTIETIDKNLKLLNFNNAPKKGYREQHEKRA